MPATSRALYLPLANSALASERSTTSFWERRKPPLGHFVPGTPEEKLGVRIEDIFYVDGNGNLVSLSAGLPRTAEEVEAAMAGK